MAVDRLFVELSDGGVRLSVQLDGELAASPVGEPAELVSPFTTDDLDDLRWYLEDYLLAPFGVYEDRGPGIADRLAPWGEALFRTVFRPGPARDAYVRVRAREHVDAELYVLSSSAELLGWPWELMRDPDRGVPLALELAAMGRMLPTGGLPEAVASPGEGLRVLMVVARPSGLDDVGFGMIARPLLERLEPVRGHVELEVLRPPTFDAFKARLATAVAEGRPFHVVHFDGHGVLKRRAAGGGGRSPVMFAGAGAEGVVLFEAPSGGGDEIPAGEFASEVRAGKVPVVVLNACQSGALGDETKAAIATRVLEEGASSVVAMGYSVYVVAAAEFMAEFYDGLFAGDTVAAAVRRGRQRLRRQPDRPSPKGLLPLEDWMVPVHYLRREVSFPGLQPEPVATATGGLSLDAMLDRLRPGGAAAETTSADDPLAPVDRFVGRDGVFYELEVATRYHRVVVVHGPGGTGKTEVAKAFGRWWKDTSALDHADGVVFCSFEPGVASFGLDGIVSRIGFQLFGVDFGQLDGERRREVVISALRDHRLLVLWDNFETVHSMPDPTQATPPLTTEERDELRGFADRLAAPGGKSALLITSRNTEAWLGDVRRIALGGLDRQAAAEYAEELLRPLPRARIKRQERSYAELVEWLEGHPLAMRIMLPQLEGIDPAVLLAALKGTADLPAGFEAGAGRTHSLAASVNYSLVHLDPEPQRLLSAAVLFEGVVDIEVLANMSSRDSAPARFRGVDGAAWGEAFDQGARFGLVTAVGHAMYQTHPALPALLTARWRHEDPDNFAASHEIALDAISDAYNEFSYWLVQQINSGGAAGAFDRIHRQRRTMGRLLARALDLKHWAVAKDLVPSLNEYWGARGETKEASAWVDRIRVATEQPDGTPPSLETAAGSLWLFAVSSQANRDAEAHRLDRAQATFDTIRSALEARAVTGQRDERDATVYYQLGLVAQKRGEFDVAENWYRQSLSIDEQLNDRSGIANDYQQLGTVATKRGELDVAENRYRKSLTIREELDDQPGMAKIYNQLGIVATQRGELEIAENWFLQTLSIDEQSGDRPGMASDYHQLGTVARGRGELDVAENWYRKSLTISEQLNDRPLMATSYHELGWLARQRGELDVAENWFRTSLTIREQLDDQLGMAQTHAALRQLAGAWDTQG